MNMIDQGIAVAPNTISFPYYLRHIAPVSRNPVIRMECKEYKRLVGNQSEYNCLRDWTKSTLVKLNRKAERLRELSHSLRADFSDRTATALPEPRDCDPLGVDSGCYVRRVHTRADLK